ncbi:nucleolar protein 8-like [Hydractinia symbiolongicarpus]|uniref:nucleolar protein 8-like n=1 Tax=Hydractinia symbiolongicarpus TaxID=13093 RepID=UPI00254FBE0A|nr:nucleolar protein 8-like [Hydractinia symbiolongicarpus]
MEQQLSSYRVFVGGLFPSVTKEDLSGKFKSFGNVTDVVVIQRKDDEGHVSKTFGYVSLESTLSKLNKCFALFGGTKWKGHSLKVQLAKEDFMARLEKERSYPEQFIKKSKRNRVEPMKKYEEFVSKSSAMKRAVPGTPVQGEKDWVVGKYGRPLPVVAIRKWAGQKLVKVDPSKHCHCLKKITLNETEFEADISDLTWTLNDDQGDDSIMKNQKRKKKKEKHHDVEEHKRSKKKKRDSDVENEFKHCHNECSSVKHNTNGEFQESVSSAKKNKKTDKEDVTPKTKNKIGLKNADQETPSQKKENLKSFGVKKDPIKTTMLPLDSISFNEESNTKEDSRNVEKECIFTESIEVGKNESSDSEDVPNDNILSMSIVEQLLNRSKSNSVRIEEVVQKSPTPHILHPGSDDNNSESEYENVNLFDFTFDNLKNSTTLYSYDVTSSVVKKDDDSSQSESESSDQSIIVQQNKVETIGKSEKTKSQSTEDNASADSVDSSRTTQKQKPASQRKEINQQQKILSEEARINSLKLREQKSLQNKEAVQAALRSIDTSSNSGLNRIVFSESESESESENVDPCGISTQSTLMSDGNSDEESFKKNLFDDSESEDEEFGGIQLKPQFQGEKGQKLFKLQQRFGGDERFRLDERFAENGEDKQADKNNNSENMDSLDTDDLHQEKQMNLNVLEQVLGKSLDESGAKQKKNTRDKTFERYDPTSENHEKFEIAKKKETERQINDSGDEEEEDEEEEEKKKKEGEKKNMEPTVSTEQFFSVNKSLKDLFSGSKQETFSFLSSASNMEENEVQEEEEIEEEKKVSTKEVSWMKALDEAAKNPVDEEMQETLEETVEVDETDEKCVTFFFTKDDERFKIGKDFVRTNTIEEITSQWEALRKNLYEDSRKKHKDAVRRIRKLKDRKFTST